MRVLVATSELQGTAPGDYSWTVDGELVVVDVTECARPDRCGCGRGFPGVASRRATTTAMVVDLPHIARDDLVEVVADHVDLHWADLLIAGADADGVDPDDSIDEQLDAITEEYVANIEQVCREFPIGTIVERHGTLVSARAFPAAA